MKKSPIVARPAAVESPRHLPLVDVIVDARTELFELAVRSGLKVLETMPEESFAGSLSRRCGMPTTAANSTSPAAARTCVTRPSGGSSSTLSSRRTGSCTPSPPSGERPPSCDISGAIRIASRSAITADRLRRRPRHLPLEGLCPWRSAPHDNALGHGISPPLRPAHPAAGLRAHPAVGLSVQRLSNRAGRAGATLPRCALDRTPIHRPDRADDHHGDRHDVGLPSVRGGHDRRPDPFGSPSGVGHARLRLLMTTELLRHDRRPRRRGRPRLRSDVPRSRRASPSQRASSPYAPPKDEGRRRSRADGPLIDHWPRTGIPLRAP
jgi:hypothetical protein